ncbi:RNA polymerase sigma-70 factor (sigma-E family) [Kribbella voronezhensis]|uniref:RNA polymerase sigma-70 factor (Sigma-E family) n=1 Tax=Kribbella voronezhensis TaxID=2512212 RepID=A0A4R7TFD5_9ACTN|nr:SigE family RNA polymerase sigma factor [Kribbella voronezhensis]TDU90256.1 RNA polymerase sigma-70 factor (sigma-E family) [Kribbella voronezhensis]
MRAQDERHYVEYVTARLPELRRLAGSLCKDAHRADDVVQNAITKLYVHWHRARTADNLDAYVRTIVVRTFLNDQRLRWSRVRLTEELTELPAQQPREVETRLVIAEALRRLPPKLRAVLVLRFLYDLSVRDAATTLGCSENTVKSQTARGLAVLRQSLGDRVDLKPQAGKGVAQ